MFRDKRDLPVSVDSFEALTAYVAALTDLCVKKKLFTMEEWDAAVKEAARNTKEQFDNKLKKDAMERLLKGK